jgi:hypothetical protein
MFLPVFGSYSSFPVSRNLLSEQGPIEIIKQIDFVTLSLEFLRLFLLVLPFLTPLVDGLSELLSLSDGGLA